MYWNLSVIMIDFPRLVKHEFSFWWVSTMQIRVVRENPTTWVTLGELPYI
jgi:hypothetical protein